MFLQNIAPSIVTLSVILSLKCCGSLHVRFPILNIFVFSSFIFASDAFEWRLYVSNIALNSQGVALDFYCVVSFSSEAFDVIVVIYYFY